MCPETGCLVTFAAYDGYKSCDITTFNVSKGSISFSLQIFNKACKEKVKQKFVNFENFIQVELKAPK